MEETEVLFEYTQPTLPLAFKNGAAVYRRTLKHSLSNTDGEQMVKVGEGFGSDPRSHIYVHKNDKKLFLSSQ